MTARRPRGVDAEKAIKRLWDIWFPVQIQVLTDGHCSASAIFWYEDEEEARQYILKNTRESVRFRLSRAPRKEAEEVRRQKIQEQR